MYFFLKPIRRLTPTKTSKITIEIAMGNTNGIRNHKSNTVGPKYSSSLNENPTGSFNLIIPEKIKSTPTKNLKKCVINFILNPYELMQKLHN